MVSPTGVVVAQYFHYEWLTQLLRVYFLIKSTTISTTGSRAFVGSTISYSYIIKVFQHESLLEIVIPGHRIVIFYK